MLLGIAVYNVIAGHRLERSYCEGKKLMQLDKTNINLIYIPKPRLMKNIFVNITHVGSLGTC